VFDPKTCQNILWDLDGTLTDPKEGIIGCIQYALVKFGRIAPPTDDLLWCIGPPLVDSFTTLVPGASVDDAWTMTGFYRERFSTLGLFENQIYPGIKELLGDLSKCHKLYLATSKPHVFAKRILKHFKIGGFFTAIHGAELDGTRSDKAELIRFILTHERLRANESVMIGDRKHDIIGAKKNAMPAIGALWGYGGLEELQDSQADVICADVSTLRQLIEYKCN
jgi:phosphoglycolate phosphatase